MRQSVCQENKCCAMAETMKRPSLYLQHVAMCSIRDCFLFSTPITVFLQVIKISRVKASNFGQENNTQSNLRFDRKHKVLLKQKKKITPHLNKSEFCNSEENEKCVYIDLYKMVYSQQT